MILGKIEIFHFRALLGSIFDAIIVILPKCFEIIFIQFSFQNIIQVYSTWQNVTFLFTIKNIFIL